MGCAASSAASSGYSTVKLCQVAPTAPTNVSDAGFHDEMVKSMELSKAKSLNTNSSKETGFEEVKFSDLIRTTDDAPQETLPQQQHASLVASQRAHVEKRHQVPRIRRIPVPFTDVNGLILEPFVVNEAVVDEPEGAVTIKSHEHEPILEDPDLCFAVAPCAPVQRAHVQRLHHALNSIRKHPAEFSFRVANLRHGMDA